MNPRLLVISGLSSGRVQPLSEKTCTVGRSREVDLYIDDPALSDTQFSILFKAGRYELQGHKSANKTLHNGAVVIVRVSLSHGDRIRAGKTQIVFLNEYWASLETVSGNHAPAQYKAVSPGTLLRGLSEFHVVLGNSRDVPTIRKELTQFILGHFPCNRVGIFLANRGSIDNWVCEPGSVPGELEDDDRNMVLQAWETNIAKMRLDPKDQTFMKLRDPGFERTVCSPLNGLHERLGVMYVGASAELPVFAEEHFELLRIVSASAGTALEQACFRDHLRSTQGEDGLLGDSEAIVSLRKSIAKTSRSAYSILIQGETGTGKEVVARAIHRQSKRADQVFVAVNCAAMGDNLIESHLFGHEKGAFTGADCRRIGQLEHSSGGTIFLDEVGELELSAQAKLLRALQDRKIQRLGSNVVVSLDLRIIAATNRDLLAAVEAKKFREDLYYRLNEISVKTPPLRDRGEDVILLARHFIHKYSEGADRVVRDISPEVKRIFLGYKWPGNVRQLENAIKSALAMGIMDTILPEDLPDEIIAGAAVVPENMLAAFDDLVIAYKQKVVTDAFEKAGGDYKKAALILRLHPKYMHRLLRTLNLMFLIKASNQLVDAGNQLFTEKRALPR